MSEQITTFKPEEDNVTTCTQPSPNESSPKTDFLPESTEDSLDAEIQKKLQILKDAIATDDDGDVDMSVDLFTDNVPESTVNQDDQLIIEEAEQSCFRSFSFNENEIPIDVDTTETFSSFSSSSSSSSSSPPSSSSDEEGVNDLTPTQVFNEEENDEEDVQHPKILQHNLSDTDKAVAWVLENIPDYPTKLNSPTSVHKSPPKPHVQPEPPKTPESPYFFKTQEIKGQVVNPLTNWHHRTQSKHSKSLRGKDMFISAQKPPKIQSLRKSVIPSAFKPINKEEPKINTLIQVVQEEEEVTNEHATALENLLKQSNDCLSLALNSKNFLKKTTPVAILAAKLVELNKQVAQELFDISKAKQVRTPAKKSLIPTCPKPDKKRKREETPDDESSVAKKIKF